VCMDRIQHVIASGGEPYAQPFLKLNALEKKPAIRHDWTEEKLRRVKRWVNWRAWKSVPFDQYDPNFKTSRHGAAAPHQPIGEFGWS
ncbi:MAG TPA: hypothetical protein VJ846_12815, partial [Sphingomicrobium sp.]|nr:hypothetical protein [Sphingomicrobium sp.]